MPDKDRARQHLNHMMQHASGHVFEGPAEQCQCGVVFDNWMRRMKARRRVLVTPVPIAPCPPCRYSEV